MRNLNCYAILVAEVGRSNFSGGNLPAVLGTPRETFPGERRVAIIPRHCESLRKSGVEVLVEYGAGVESGYPDEAYAARGATLGTREQVFAQAHIVVQVRTLGANVKEGRADLALLRPGHVLVGFGEPLTAAQECADLAATGASFLALELIPRITRAQSMDVLSAMATISGYRAALLAATTLPRMFPMMTTAAGTITPAKVFVLGAGVAGLQAIATARRLGAVVSAYDLRPAVKEQVESVGAKFIILNVDSQASEDKGGYAKAMDESFYRRQRELLTDVIREQDVLITTAAVPGRKAPILVTREMAEAMQPGSVIVDIAAERGGNCELTLPGEAVIHGGVTILGPLNLPSTLPYHASQMFSSNIAALVKLLFPKGELKLNREDEIVRESLVTHENQVVHPRVLEVLNSQLANATAGVRS